ncbi:hypothetical protein V5O48_006347 [Marasmius crinis-equi]|uniref:Uncharacterized protein n=1 Tax=Marasmius crinis-equi TaxID=585013 RepID=A0ABR3FJR8_9AGAR
MLARLSKTTVKALGLKFPQGSITASRLTSGSSDGDELVIDLDLLQLVRPVQDLCRTLAPVWSNIQSTLSYDVEQMALLLLELEEQYPEEEEELIEYAVSNDGDDDPEHVITCNTATSSASDVTLKINQKSPYLYGERPPRIQRNSSHVVGILESVTRKR